MKKYKFSQLITLLLCLLLLLPSGLSFAQDTESELTGSVSQSDEAVSEAESEISETESIPTTASEDSDLLSDFEEEIVSESEQEIQLLTEDTSSFSLLSLDTSSDFSSGWTALTADMTSLTDGSYYLDSDIKTNQSIQIVSGANVTLDLNGHVLTAKWGSGPVIVNYGELTIEDSQPDIEHKGYLRFVNSLGNTSSKMQGIAYTDPDGNDWYSGLWCWESGGLEFTSYMKNDVSVYGGIITGGSSSGIQNYGGLTLNGGGIIGNYANAASIGAAITSDGYRNKTVQYLKINGGKIAYNYSPYGSERYGAVYIYNCETKITGGQFFGNAACYGGAIFIEGNNLFSKDRPIEEQRENLKKVAIGCGKENCQNDCVVMEGNHSHRGGGAIYTSTPGGVCEILCGTIEHNWTDTNEYGTGSNSAYEIESVNDIRCNAGLLTVDGGEIGLIENRFFNDTQGLGRIDIKEGLIHMLMNYGGTTYITGGKIGYIKANQSPYLSSDKIAVIYISGGEINQAYSALGNYMKQADPQGNTIAESGISITGGQVYMTGGAIRNCYEANSGGAVRIWNGTFSMSNPDTDDADIPVIENCQAGVNGGAIYIKSSSSTEGYHVTLTGGRIQNCQAQSGGAIYLEEGNLFFSKPDKEALVQTEPIITNCSASQGDGGGICVTGGQVLISGGTVSANSASDDGGGLAVLGGIAEFSAGNILKNQAGNDGGGISIEGDPDSESNTVIIEDQILIQENTAETGNGGGINVKYANLEMNGGKILSNQVNSWSSIDNAYDGNGGGAYVGGGTVTMRSTVIDSNTCPQNGGGLYINGLEQTNSENQKLTVTLVSGDVRNNMAGQCGGGIASYQVQVLMQENENGVGTRVVSNEAVKGGGVFVRDDADIQMTGGCIYNNHAVSLENVSESDHSFYLPIKEAAGFGTSGTENKTGLIFVDSQDTGGNGGGLYLQNSGFKIQAEKTLNSGSISSNTADCNGGGIYALHTNAGADTSIACTSYTVDIDISNGTLIGNTAGRHGGGVALFALNCTYEPDVNASVSDDDIHQHCKLNIHGSVYITLNQAQCGGALYIGGGAAAIEGGIIRENRAVGNPAEGITTAYNPSDNVGVGGGVYVYRNGALSLKNTVDVNKDSAGADNSQDTSKELDLGVYSNTADFAADDVYCADGSESKILIPAVNNMDLIDYVEHRIGYAENWFEDYPTDDTEYDQRGSNTSKSSMIRVVRYRSAKADDVNKVAVLVQGEEATYEGYLCLTLGFNYTRVNLTISNHVDGGDPGETEYNYTVKIYAEGIDLSKEKKAGYTYPYLIFGALKSEEGLYDYTVTEGMEVNGISSDSPTDTVVRFSLKNNEYIILEGIPVDAKVTVIENGVPITDTAGITSSIDQYSLDGYIPSYTYTQREVSITLQNAVYEIASISDTYASLDSTNTAGYILPDTGKHNNWMWLIGLGGFLLLFAFLIEIYQQYKGST